MQRVTFTVDDDLLAELDRLVGLRGYKGRSEAIRTVAREGVRQALLETGSAPDCVAALVYVYDHGARELARRLAQVFADHHDLSVATTHIHLNHESGMEVAMLRGPTQQVQDLATVVLAERGVRHGRIIIVPVVTDAGEHSHPDDGHVAGGRTHTHVRAR